MHDFNGGVAPSGLFWTVPLPEDAVVVSPNGRELTVAVQDLALVDDVLRPTPITVPATVTFRVEWRGKRRLVRRGRGLAVAPTDPAAFRGEFYRRTRARGTFAGAIEGFSFQSEPVIAKSRFALLGRERNGVFLAGEAAAGCRRCVRAPSAAAR